MLAQSFLSAVELGITEPQRDALCKTLVLLETRKLVHVTGFDVIKNESGNYTGHFNMRAWAAEADCGTVRCIGGTAEAVGNVKFDNWSSGAPHQGTPKGRLYNLFAPAGGRRTWNKITDSQAATALRSYLTTGDAKWHEAVA